MVSVTSDKESVFTACMMHSYARTGLALCNTLAMIMQSSSRRR